MRSVLTTRSGCLQFWLVEVRKQHHLPAGIRGRARSEEAAPCVEEGSWHDLSTSRITTSKHAQLLLLPSTKPHCLLEGAAMVARWHGRGACHPADRRRRDASSPQPSLLCNSSTNCVIWEQQTTCWRYSGTAASSHTTSNDAGAALGGGGRWIMQGRHRRRTARSGGSAIWGLPRSLPLNVHLFKENMSKGENRRLHPRKGKRAGEMKGIDVHAYVSFSWFVFLFLFFPFYVCTEESLINLWKIKSKLINYTISSSITLINILGKVWKR